MENKKLYPPPPSYTDLVESPTAPPSEEPMQSASPSPPPNPYQYQQMQQSPPPNPYQYQQMPQPIPPTVVQPQTVVHHSTVLVNTSRPGMTCPHCHARVSLTVERHATCNTWLLAGLLCLCFWWPCVCLPCCCNWCYRTSQYCPNCKACLGSF